MLSIFNLLWSRYRVSGYPGCTTGPLRCEEDDDNEEDGGGLGGLKIRFARPLVTAIWICV